MRLCVLGRCRCAGGRRVMGFSWEWTITYEPGATCRSIMWSGREVAVINPRGDFDEQTESDLSAGIAHAARMHLFLRRLRQDGLTDGLKRELAEIDRKSTRLNSSH